MDRRAGRADARQGPRRRDPDPRPADPHPADRREIRQPRNKANAAGLPRRPAQRPRPGLTTRKTDRMARYNVKETESRWQRRWAEAGCFEVEVDPARPKYYGLEMFPYPSGRIPKTGQASCRERGGQYL